MPFLFFRDNKSRFDIRSSGEKFDLHISTKQRNWLVLMVYALKSLNNSKGFGIN